MTLRTKLEIAAGIVLLILAALGFRAWLDDHDARLQLKAELAAQQSVIQQADQRIADRQSELAKSLADYEGMRRQQVTQQQAVKELPKLIDVPLPTPIETPLPDAPGVLIPKEDVAPLRDMLIQCKEDKLKLTACKQDEADSLVKIDALGKQRDAAEKAVKGGTKWQRFKRSMKYIGIGAAIGVAAGYAAHR